MIDEQDLVLVSTDHGECILRIVRTHAQRAYFNVLYNNGLEVYEEIPFIYRTDNEGNSSIEVAMQAQRMHFENGETLGDRLNEGDLTLCEYHELGEMIRDILDEVDT